MNISIIQMEIEDGARRQNIENALSFLERCKNSDLVVLPELWSTGLSLHRAADLAEPLTGETISFLKAYAATYKTYVLGSILEKRKSKFYNTLHVVGPEGLLGVYRKIHLFSLMNEPRYLEPGTEYAPFSTELLLLLIFQLHDL